ncbi:MAG: 3-dehydroquinate synthase [archaeon]
MNVIVRLKKKIDDSYGISIGNYSPAQLAAEIKKDGFGSDYCIVCDSNVKKLFGTKLLSELRKKKMGAGIVSFEAGEKNKSLRNVEAVLEGMLSKRFDRKSCVIALGGGISGDLAGFAASIYLRGINFVQVPTTLLAMVDSSIGGKTGANLSLGKNTVGTFAQPKKVYVSTQFIRTLSEKEFSNGMAEVVKQAVLNDAKFFSFLENNSQKILAREPKIMAEVIKRNCELKARVVEKDEKEMNYRRVLNLGHTIGHAIETLGKYTTHSHGEAVSIGMAVENRIAVRLGLLQSEDECRISVLLHEFGLPTELPDYEPEKILALTERDKKAVSGKVRYSLPIAIGKMYSHKGSYGIFVDDKTVLEALRCSDDCCSCCCG